MKIGFSNSQIESQFLNWWQTNLLTDNPLKCRVQFVNNQCLMSFSMDFHCVWVINNWAFVFVLKSLSLPLSSFLFCLCVDVVLSFIISRWCLWVVVVEIFLFQFSDDDTQSRCIISCCWCSSSLFCVRCVSCVSCVRVVVHIKVKVKFISQLIFVHIYFSVDSFRFQRNFKLKCLTSTKSKEKTKKFLNLKVE